MTLSPHTLADIKRMTLREFKLVRMGVGYWRMELRHLLAGRCGLG